ncbi:site-specific integrase [Natronomonas gomsonensis]|uniref:site-specific integrase n=1 Tax=Natronomonas gomsonensis TaxID=1046043 RepID=UPI0020CA61F3|nr:site-specific integrase [Natronomonas gomsonensis]MCY4730566.1 site-specific integrase [Natronomonas gomsonensis]
MGRKKNKDVEDLKDNFINWITTRKTGNSIDTAKTYWNQVKDLPHSNLIEDSQILIQSRINENIDNTHQQSSARQFLEYLFENEKERISNGDYSIPYLLEHFDEETVKHKLMSAKEAQEVDSLVETDDVEPEDIYDVCSSLLRTKKNNIKVNIEIDQSQKGDDKGPNINYHFIPKKELVQLLQAAKPKRAKFWSLLYFLGCRYGELKRLEYSQINFDYGEHGKLEIPAEKTKSKAKRQIEFENPVTPRLLKDVFGKTEDSKGYVGTWEDQNSIEWEDVCFPEVKNSSENYQLGKEKDGTLYGLAMKETGLQQPRTIHSFRHTRITDLIKGEEKDWEVVQDRAGHSDPSTTKYYQEATFVRPPQSIEQYCDQNDIDLMEVIESES